MINGDTLEAFGYVKKPARHMGSNCVGIWVKEFKDYPDSPRIKYRVCLYEWLYEKSSPPKFWTSEANMVTVSSEFQVRLVIDLGISVSDMEEFHATCYKCMHCTTQLP